MKSKACMLVLNAVTSDPRVCREGSALADAGWEVLVLGVMDRDPVRSGEQDGFSFYRIAKRRRISVPTSPRQMVDGLRDFALGVLRSRFPEPYQRARSFYLAKRYRRGLPPHLEIRNGVLTSVRGEPRGPEDQGPVEDSPARGKARREEPPARYLPEHSADLARDLGEIWNTLVWNLQLARVGVQERADVYHAHDLNTLLAGVICKLACGSRLVFDAHEIYDLQLPPEAHTTSWRRYHSFLQRTLPRFADERITVSEGLADWLGGEVPGPRFKVVRNLPAHLGDPDAERAPCRRTGTLALYHGGFAPGRGLEELIEAARYLEPGFKIALRGSGPQDYVAHLKSLIAERGVEERVVFYDPVPMRMLVAAARDADIGLLPYQPTCVNNYYSLPNKIFEYFAAGLPVVASDLPEIRRLIHGYDTGVLVDFRHPPSVGEAINRLLRATSVREEMGRNALAAGDGPLSWERESERLKALYAGLR